MDSHHRQRSSYSYLSSSVDFTSESLTSRLSLLEDSYQPYVIPAHLSTAARMAATEEAKVSKPTAKRTFFLKDDATKSKPITIESDPQAHSAWRERKVPSCLIELVQKRGGGAPNRSCEHLERSCGLHHIIRI